MTTLEHDLLHLVLKLMEKHMADFTNLKQSITELAAKVDALVNQPAPPPPVDYQPQVDELEADVRAMLAKLP